MACSTSPGGCFTRASLARGRQAQGRVCQRAGSHGSLSCLRPPVGILTIVPCNTRPTGHWRCCAVPQDPWLLSVLTHLLLRHSSAAPPRVGYVSFLFFRSKAWWVPLAKQLLRCALWVVGVTQRLPLARVCEAAQTLTCCCRSHSSALQHVHPSCPLCEHLPSPASCQHICHGRCHPM